MPEYDLLFVTMYESVVDALGEMEKMNFGKAKEILIFAQQHGRNACLFAAGYDPNTAYVTPAAVTAEVRRRRRLKEESGKV